jgi:hypothetical protein
MKNNLGVRGRRKYRAFAFQSLSLFAGKGQIAIVTNGNLAMLASDQEWLAFAN